MGQYKLVYILVIFLRILGPLCLASLSLEGLDQARLPLTLSRQHIRTTVDPKATLPHFAQPGGIGSSSFTFDSVAAAY